MLSNDLKHPSAKGYQVMAESLFDEIKNIPFPPVNIKVTSRDGNAVYAFSPRADVARRRSKMPPRAADLTAGTLISWQDNPKIFDRTRIQGYKIYRKDRFHPQGRFRLLTFVRSSQEFFDPGLHTIDRYVYVLSTVRSDGIEGHGSSQVHE